MTTKALDALNDAAINSTYKNNPAENPIANAKKQFEEDFNTLKSMYGQMSKGQFEHKLYNFVNQMDASQEMASAAAQGKRYEFENGRDNAMLSAVLAAQRTNSIKAFQQAVRNSGMEMTAEEFETAYGVKLADTKYATPEEFSNKIADDIGKYAEMIDGIKRKVGVLSDPSRFESGTSGRYMAAIQRKAEEEAIHTLALNMIKADMTIDRAQKLAQEMRATPGLAGSADYAIRVMTDPDVLVAEVGNMMSEIKLLEDQIRAEGLTPEMKDELVKQLENKKKRRDFLERWQRYWGEVKLPNGKSRLEFRGQAVGKAKEEHASGDGTTVEAPEFDMKHPEVYANFKEVMQLMNEQAGLGTELNDTVAQEAFDKLVDYMRLDADSKSFLNSVDVLFNRNRFGNMLRNMTDGQFKYMLINYVDNILDLIKNHTANLVTRVGEEDGAAQLNLMVEISELIIGSEAYKNLETLALDPNVGVKNQEYARKQEQALSKLVSKKMTEYYDLYLQKAGYTDISDDDYLTFKQTGGKYIPWLNLVGIARKIALEIQSMSPEEQEKATTFKTLGERETEVYAAFKDMVDPVVEEYVENGEVQKPEVRPDDPAKEAPLADRAAKNADDEEDDEFDDEDFPDETTKNPTASTGQRYKLVEDLAFGFGIFDTEKSDYWYGADDMAVWSENRAEVEAMVEALNNGGKPGASPANNSEKPAEKTTESAGAGMSSSNPTPDESEDNEEEGEGRSIDDIMKRMRGEDTDEQTDEEPFEVTDTPGGFDVTDSNGDPVNDEPIPTEDEANDLKNSLVNTYTDVEVAREFMGTDATAAQDAEFVRRAHMSMEKNNTKFGTEHKNLAEYGATARGKNAMRTIASNVKKMQATDAPSEKPVVISTDLTAPVDQFSTTSTGQTTVVTLESLKLLDSKVQEFKAKVSKGGQEISKFVEEDTSTKTSAPKITEQELLNILNDIHACS